MHAVLNTQCLKQQHCCRQAEEAEFDILAGAGALLGRAKQLPSGMIETTRLRDANQQEPSSGVVQSVEFHPAGRLLLTAGLDKRLRLFQVKCPPLTLQHDITARPVSLVFISTASELAGSEFLTTGVNERQVFSGQENHDCHVQKCAPSTLEVIMSQLCAWTVSLSL